SKFPLRLEHMARAPKTWVGPSSGAGDPTKPNGVVANHPQAQRARPVASVGDPADRHRPTGLGMDSHDVRRRMVERLSAAGPHHARVLEALASVPRHQFVDAALVTQAYEDTSLPIGHGQTISKPSVVARMLDVLMNGATARSVGHLGRVLEIGTGCGYQAAVLCCLGRQVVSVERIRGLYDKARDLVAPLRMNQLRLVYGDGMLGHAPNAPYDSIIAAACGASVPESWLNQLAVGGRLISPVDDAVKGQKLVVVDRLETGYQRTEYEAVQFVPLKSGSI
ncbi:MAG: protein-L-isoaspartate(D-aspartate) O-methyltransferase, partial [Pseudomonadota bacterium]|nr:protein-L-isoaspartate(D-aspartate) O-methyltransferase [Pseudomonadota bacterium]